MLVIALRTVEAALRQVAADPLAVAFALLMASIVVAGGGWWWLRRRRDRAIEAQRRFEANVTRISTLSGLLSLSPVQFELAIRDLLCFWGFPYAQHTGRGGDLAADIICRDAAGYVTVVQCKRYSPGNLVGSPDVQTFIGMIYAHHSAHHGIYVTTSGFTQPALSLARQHHIQTIDGNELVWHIQRWRSAIQQAAAADGISRRQRQRGT